MSVRPVLSGRIRSISTKTIITMVVTAIAVLQVIRVGQFAYPLLVNKAWADRHLDPISRSADAAYGQSYLSAVQALRRQIPPDAKVILTGTTGQPQYDARDFMQYFLLPRQVETLQCPGDLPVEECIRSLAGPEIYFLVGESLESPFRLQEQLRVTPLGAGVSLLGPLTANE